MPRYYHIARENLHQRSEPLGVPHGFGEEWCAVFESDVTQTKGVPFTLLSMKDTLAEKGFMERTHLLVSLITLHGMLY